MGLTQADYMASLGITSTANQTAGTTATATLVAPPINGAIRIRWVCGYASAGSNFDINVTENGGTAICRIGGSLNSSASSVSDFPGPGIICKKNDAAKVVMTTNSSGVVQVTVGYDFVPA